MLGKGTIISRLNVSFKRTTLYVNLKCHSGGTIKPRFKVSFVVQIIIKNGADRLQPGGLAVMSTSYMCSIYKLCKSRVILSSNPLSTQYFFMFFLFFMKFIRIIYFSKKICSSFKL